MSKRTVLVAEDDAGLRALLRLLLEEGGYHAVMCEDGRAAWDRLQQGGIDIAVLDIGMPEMDGLELCRRIRSNESLKQMPIVMLTIRALVEDQVHGYGGGADDYVTKPFSSDVLLARIRSLERRLLGPAP